MNIDANLTSHYTFFDEGVAANELLREKHVVQDTDWRSFVANAIKDLDEEWDELGFDEVYFERLFYGFCVEMIEKIAAEEFNFRRFGHFDVDLYKYETGIFGVSIYSQATGLYLTIELSERQAAHNNSLLSETSIMPHFKLFQIDDESEFEKTYSAEDVEGLLQECCPMPANSGQ
jgi:hypothetical protein